ncbi:MAG: YlxR family protein [Nodosilinea sp.]
MQPNYRRCVSCRRVGPKAEFWRLVRVYPDRTVQIEAGMGRSAYLCPTADCLRQAQKKGKLKRALRTSVPEEIYCLLEQRLEVVSSPAAPHFGRATDLRADCPTPTSATKT